MLAPGKTGMLFQEEGEMDAWQGKQPTDTTHLADKLQIGPGVQNISRSKRRGSHSFPPTDHLSP